jgi:hypothetical protein
VKVPFFYKALYYMSLVYDYSRRTWVYFFIIKSEVFSRFKEFKYLLENHIGRTIKMLRTDNGSCFCYAKFDKSSKENGIEIHNTIPCTLSRMELQNG